MLAILGVLILVVPIVELAIIIAVGREIGVLPTIALLVFVSVSGAVLLKREGTATWRRLRQTMERGQMPTAEVTDGALILLGGALLLTPGFLTDAIGLVLIFSPTRRAIKGAARRGLGVLALRRFGVAGAAASAGRKVYSARVVRARRATATPPSSLPSEPPHASSADGSPGKG